MTTNAVDKPPPKIDVKFWVTISRGLFAVVLGIALFIQPDKARPILVNFMGMFWLAGGLVSIRWGAAGEQARRWSFIAGAIGVLAGLIAVTRHILSGYVNATMVAYLLGSVMALTGLMHMIFGFPIKSGAGRRSWASVVLGIFEFILGLMLVISPFNYGPVVYWAVTLWAFLGGLILFNEAWRHRKQLKQKEESKQEAVSTQTDREVVERSY